MKSRSLFSRYIASLLLVMFVFLTTMAIALALGISRGLEMWKQQQGEAIREFASAELTNVYQIPERRNGESVNDYLSPFLDPSIFLFVFDNSDELVFSYWEGRSWYLDGTSAEQTIRHQGESALEEFLETSEPIPQRLENNPDKIPDLFGILNDEGAVRPVLVDGLQVASFAARSNGFTITQANKRLIDTMVSDVGVGLAAAVTAGLLSTILQGRRIGQYTSRVAEKNHTLTEGGVDPISTDSPVKELRSIVESVSLLQRRLEHERGLRRQWALDIAHDLRTPIAGLRAQLEGLADGVLQPSNDRFSQILKELGRVEELSDSFLLLTRVESPEMELNPSPISLDEVGRAT